MAFAAWLSRMLMLNGLKMAGEIAHEEAVMTGLAVEMIEKAERGYL